MAVQQRVILGRQTPPHARDCVGVCCRPERPDVWAESLDAADGWAPPLPPRPGVELTPLGMVGSLAVQLRRQLDRLEPSDWGAAVALLTTAGVASYISSGPSAFTVRR